MTYGSLRQWLPSPTQDSSTLYAILMTSSFLSLEANASIPIRSQYKSKENWIFLSPLSLCRKWRCTRFQKMFGKLLTTFQSPRDLLWFLPVPCKLLAPRYWFSAVWFQKTRWIMTRHLMCRRMALKWLCPTKAWFSMSQSALLSMALSLQHPPTLSLVATNCPTKTKSTR